VSQGQPRLAIAVKTLSRVAVDLAHLCLVFLLIFSAYLMSGHILFGRRMEEFSTIKGALGFCLQIVFQREYAWEKFSTQDLGTTMLWVCTFMFLCVLVVVNIVLAIVFNTYGSVRVNLLPTDTIWHAAALWFSKLKHVPHWESNHSLLTTLSSLSDGEPMTAKRLRTLYPNMCQEQISFLFNQAKQKLLTGVVNGNPNLVAISIVSIFLGVEDLRAGICVVKGKTTEEIGRQPFGEGSKVPEVKDKTAEEVRRQQVSEVPEAMPDWTKDGLQRHLETTRLQMQKMMLQMEEIEAKLTKRGIGDDNDADFPLAKPVGPRFGRNLDLTNPMSATLVSCV